ncbi:hypothetical protein BDR26DRAFT_559334 [Obelidium mucronatum]|nr:hypothetical protein BDR26DRAFT_559334 [Obelidium mucronatum]
MILIVPALRNTAGDGGNSKLSTNSRQSSTSNGDGKEGVGLNGEVKAFLFQVGIRPKRAVALLWKSASMLGIPELDMLIILGGQYSGTFTLSECAIKVIEKTTVAAKKSSVLKNKKERKKKKEKTKKTKWQPRSSSRRRTCGQSSASTSARLRGLRAGRRCGGVRLRASGRCSATKTRWSTPRAAQTSTRCGASARSNCGGWWAACWRPTRTLLVLVRAI